LIRSPARLKTTGGFEARARAIGLTYRRRHALPCTRPFDRVGVQHGTVYLDAGCGAGLAAWMAAARGTNVTGIARTRVPGGDFRLGDLESLPFGDGEFDVVTGFNSFQYAGNSGIALGEAKRVARSGASVAIMTWGTPDGMEAASLVTALKPLLPAPPPGAPGPFALSDDVCAAWLRVRRRPPARRGL
jgi:SAM-dependent methyltransferase